MGWGCCLVEVVNAPGHSKLAISPPPRLQVRFRVLNSQKQGCESGSVFQKLDPDPGFYKYEKLDPDPH